MAIVRSCLVTTLGRTLYRADFESYQNDPTPYLTMTAVDSGRVWVQSTPSFKWEDDDLHVYGFIFKYLGELEEVDKILDYWFGEQPPEEDIWL